MPPKFTVGEARDIGRRYTCLDEFAPVRDESAELGSRHLWEYAHKAIQQEDIAEPKAFVQEAEHAAAESSDSSRTHSVCGEEMVTRKTLTVSHFIPVARQAA